MQSSEIQLLHLLFQRQQVQLQLEIPKLLKAILMKLLRL